MTTRQRQEQEKGMGESDNKNALVGVNPETKIVTISGYNNEETALEIRECGLIAVPVSMASARTLFGEVIDDIYSL